MEWNLALEYWMFILDVGDKINEGVRFEGMGVRMPRRE